MRSFIKIFVIAAVVLAIVVGGVYLWTEFQNSRMPAPAKPVIYLYPEAETDVHVLLDYDGELTTTYPAYPVDGWRVTAMPDGTLFDADGREYSYLFWEGRGAADYDFSEGFVVSGDETVAFLQEILPEIGLTPRECNEFIVYWLPQMETSAYNLISFQTQAYTDTAPLTIEPAPDSLLRVFMAWKPLKTPVDMTPQSFEPFVREGFVVVEWGGAVVS